MIGVFATFLTVITFECLKCGDFFNRFLIKLGNTIPWAENGKVLRDDDFRIIKEWVFKLWFYYKCFVS